MTLKAKKIIAREFLFLMLVTILTVIIFFITYLLNNNKQDQISELNTEINKNDHIVDSLLFGYRKKKQKQDFLLNQISREFGLSFNHAEDFLNKVLIKDSLKNWSGIPQFIPEGFNRIGFVNSKELRQSIEINKFNSDDIEKQNKAVDFQIKKNELIAKREETQSHIITQSEQLRIAINRFFLLLIMIFGLRYIYYAIKWSIKVIREK